MQYQVYNRWNLTSVVIYAESHSVCACVTYLLEYLPEYSLEENVFV